MKRFIPFILFLFSSQISFGQKEIGAYIHHAEIGTLLGTSSQGSKRINFSLQSFHGVQIDPHNQIGFFVGVDTYPDFNLMPIGFGWRNILFPDKKYSFYTSIDLGYGSAWFQKKERENNVETWNEGGWMVSPAIGLRKNSKNGKLGYTCAVGFKKQYANSFVGVPITGTVTPVEGIRPGYESLFEENNIFNSLFMRMGIIF